MHISGRHTFAVGQEELFEKLQDPAILMKCIPGCEELVRDSNGCFDARLKIKFGLLRGTLQGRVTLRDVVRLQGFAMDMDGHGMIGTVRGTSRVVLEAIDAFRTEVLFESDVELGGLIGKLGQAFIPGGSRDLSGQFFSELERAIREETDPARS